MEYNIITANEIDLLVSRVQDMMSEGWQPIGGVVAISWTVWRNRDGDEVHAPDGFAQSVTRNKE